MRFDQLSALSDDYYSATSDDDRDEAFEAVYQALYLKIELEELRAKAVRRHKEKNPDVKTP